MNHLLFVCNRSINIVQDFSNRLKSNFFELKQNFKIFVVKNGLEQIKTYSKQFFILNSIYKSIVNYNFLINQIFQNTEMQVQNEGNSEKRQYARITLKNKVNLIRMVFRRRVPLQEAIQELGLKKTTALNIIKRYTDTGSFPMRKYKRTRKNKQKQSIIKIEEVEQDSQVQSVPNGQQLPNNELTHKKIQYIYSPCQYSWVGYPIAYYCSF